MAESSVARDDSVQTAASKLLSGAEIWSTETRDPAPPRPAEPTPVETPAPARARRSPSEILAGFKSASSSDRRAGEPTLVPATPAARARKLSLALQGGGSLSAFTWGVLDRLLEEPDCDIEAISGASAGALHAALLASGLVEGGREGARKSLARFWNHLTEEASFRSLLLIGAFSPAGSSIAFGPALQFDPLDLDPLREVLFDHIDFVALRRPACPKLLIATTRVRDGALRIFRNREITADVLLASTCPPLVHCAVEIEGGSYWDGGFAANPPLASLMQEGTDVLLVQVTPTRDPFVPITKAAIDRRLDQIAANAVLNAEISALQIAKDDSAKLFRIAAEDEIDELAQRGAADLGRGSVALLHARGRNAAERWLRQTGKRGAAQAEPALAL
jgi:NTE family protein